MIGVEPDGPHGRARPAPVIGLFAANKDACADPGGAARVAALAECLGYDSLWAADHVALPLPHVAPAPMAPTDPMLDPLVALAFLAGHTDRVRLCTGILVLPQRNPVVLAKQVASLDVLSAGRITLGVGAGYLEAELRAVGVPMAERGPRTDEHLAAMRSLWYDKEPAYRGRFVAFDGVDSHPRPVQDPLPIVVGGHSPAAHRRAAASADGWYGFRLGLRAVAEQVAGLRAAVRAAGRPAQRPLEVSVSPPKPLDADLVREYARLGVDRLVVVPPPGLRLADLESFVERNAPERLGARPAATT